MYGYIDYLRRFVVPDSVLYHDAVVQNPSTEILTELGYLELVETAPPSAGYVPYYVEENGKAVQHWEKEPTPTQMDIIEAQVTYTAMMTDTLLEV